METSSELQSGNHIRVAAKWIPVLFVAWFMVPFFQWCYFGDDAGMHGDAFGSVNARFSGAGLGLLIATLWMQRQELKYVGKML